MSDTVKQQTFRSGPLNNKPVSDIPGVGPMLTQKLKDANIYEAKQMYQQLRHLNFDIQAFGNWLKRIYSRARVQPCYDALMEWHRQFGEISSNNVPGSQLGFQRQSANRVTVRPGVRDRNRITAPHFGRRIVGIGTGTTSDPVMSFFVSLAETVKRFPARLHPMVKSDIFKIVNKYEVEVAQGQHTAPAASTSSAPNNIANGQGGALTSNT